MPRTAKQEFDFYNDLLKSGTLGLGSASTQFGKYLGRQGIGADRNPFEYQQELQRSIDRGRYTGANAFGDFGSRFQDLGYNPFSQYESEFNQSYQQQEPPQQTQPQSTLPSTVDPADPWNKGYVDPNRTVRQEFDFMNNLVKSGMMGIGSAGGQFGNLLSQRGVGADRNPFTQQQFLQGLVDSGTMSYQQASDNFSGQFGNLGFNPFAQGATDAAAAQQAQQQTQTTANASAQTDSVTQQQQQQQQQAAQAAATIAAEATGTQPATTDPTTQTSPENGGIGGQNIADMFKQMMDMFKKLTTNQNVPQQPPPTETQPKPGQWWQPPPGGFQPPPGYGGFPPYAGVNFQPPPRQYTGPIYGGGGTPNPFYGLPGFGGVNPQTGYLPNFYTGRPLPGYGVPQRPYTGPVQQGSGDPTSVTEEQVRAAQEQYRQSNPNPGFMRTQDFQAMTLPNGMQIDRRDYGAVAHLFGGGGGYFGGFDPQQQQLQDFRRLGGTGQFQNFQQFPGQIRPFNPYYQQFGALDAQMNSANQQQQQKQAALAAQMSVLGLDVMGQYYDSLSRNSNSVY